MDLDASVGSLFLGYTVSLCLYGITLSQIALFLHNHRNSSKKLKLIVWFIFIFESAQTVAISQGIWAYAVSGHAEPEVLARPTRSFGVVVYLTTVNNFFVRSVYAYRMYILRGRRPFLSLIVVALSLTVAVLAIIYGTQGVRRLPWSEGRSLSGVFYAGYSCELMSDVIITTTIVYIFARKTIRRNTFAQVLVAYALNSGLLVMICVVCSTISYITLPSSFAFLAFYLALGKLYANSLLGALNARDLIFPRASKDVPPTTAPLLTSVVVLECDDEIMTEVNESGVQTPSDELRSISQLPLARSTADGNITRGLITFQTLVRAVG
ncbi:hypothetical protein C8Q70DRAFT_978211 [Cubamyces menziesii]|uniref:DUF6534 domain-containing protein n=1 Tax=Trametes cubensis TaxID=1111947 RepID=A0AAD7XD45_9APHY|nr:hypothetical protein C8Q70DRAFT_978211 [Cubamyces menziesii]KAJ8481460.1 hypothetical protein ONZ51_g5988 [Trametes cubensis]